MPLLAQPGLRCVNHRGRTTQVNLTVPRVQNFFPQQPSHMAAGRVPTVSRLNDTKLRHKVEAVSGIFRQLVERKELVGRIRTIQQSDWAVRLAISVHSTGSMNTCMNT